MSDEKLMLHEIPYRCKDDAPNGTLFLNYAEIFRTQQALKGDMKRLFKTVMQLMKDREDMESIEWYMIDIGRALEVWKKLESERLHLKAQAAKDHP